MKDERYFQKCLRAELGDRIQRNSNYSLRSFARALTIDAGALSRIMSGQKVPSPELSHKIVNRLSLAPEQADSFFISIAQAYSDKKPRRKSAEVKALLKKSVRTPTAMDLSPEIFRVISDWYHYAILQLSLLDNFRAEPKWISKQLGIQEIEAKLALERLIDLKFLAEKNGKLTRTQERWMSGNLSVSTPAHRKRIKQVSEKSLDSLENDPIEIRNHTTRTMAIDPAKLPLAKKMIQDFMDELNRVLQTDKKTVYELQVNLFPLQRSAK